MKALGLDQLWWLVSPGNPLKEGAGDMAPFAARLASARRTVRRSPIRASDFEARSGSRYTVDTLGQLIRRYRNYRFIWLMGADILPQFHKWKRWRRIAQLVPIAVVGRPRYDGPARAARAMGWLRRFVRAPGQARNWTDWSLPAILLLRLPPDPTSATALRALDPQWHRNPQPVALAKRSAAGPNLRRALARPSR